MKIVYILISIIILTSGCASNQKGKDNEQMQSRYQLLQGVNYYKAKQYNQAQEAIHKSLLINPNNPQTHLMAALVNHQLGFKQRAENSFLKAMSSQPVSANILNNYANFLCENQQYIVAESYFKQAANLESNKNPDIAFTNAGICSIKSGNPGKAEAWLKKALANNPSQGPALYQLALLELDKGRSLEASTLLNQLLQHRKHTAKTLLLGAKIEQSLGNKTSVESYLNRLATDFPASQENNTARAVLAKPAALNTAVQPYTAVSADKTHSSTGESWILSRPPNNYTLQIIATRNATVVDQAYKNLIQQWNPVKYQFIRDGNTWHTLIEGDYPDSKSARQALSGLPAEIKKYHPWIRRFDSIQRVVSLEGNSINRGALK